MKRGWELEYTDGTVIKETQMFENIVIQVSGGRNSACKFWNRFWTGFSRISGIVCISGGYLDLLPGFYQVLTLNSMGNSMFQRGKPTRNLSEKTAKTL